MRRTLTTLLVACVLSGAGCSKKSAVDRGKVAHLLTTDAPTPQHALDIKFGENITLIGYDLSSDQVELGKPLNVTWYYKVTKPADKGWLLFTHLADGNNVSRINLDANGLLRAAWTPDHWEANSYVKDPQTILLPDDWTSDKVIVYLGFWKDNQRLPVTGPNDGDRRARALELPVLLKNSALPELTAVRASGEVKLDGKLEEPFWKEAQSTDAFVHTMTGKPAEPNVTVKTAWDDKNLYVAFEVADDKLISKFENADDHLWEEDTVEIMLDPDGDGKNYFEIQVSPANKVFDTRYDSRRVPKPFGHVDWNAGVVSGVSVRGKLNDDEADEGYTAEIAIPWTAFAAGTPAHEPPKAGDSWRVNFYVMDKRADKVQRAVGWSAPRVGDFHIPRKFGKLKFEGSQAPVAEGEAATSDAQKESAAKPGAKKAKEGAAGEKKTAAGKVEPKATEKKAAKDG